MSTPTNIGIAINPGNAQPPLQPPSASVRRCHQFVVCVTKGDLDLPSFLVADIRLPEINFDEADQLRYAPLNINFYASTEDNIEKKILAMMADKGRHVEVTVKMLDSLGNVCSHWLLDSKIIEVSFSNLDYQINEPFVVTMRLSVDVLTIK